MRNFMSVSLLVLSWLFVPATWAQPLVEHVPRDVVAYVGWSGSSNLGPGYEGTHLQALIKLSEIDRMISDVLPQAFRNLADNVADDDARQAADFFSVFGQAVWKHPTALFFGGMDFTGEEPAPQLAILCDAGEDADRIHELISGLLENKDDADVPTAVHKIESRVVLTVGKLSGDQQAALGLVQTLVAVPRLNENKKFQQAMQQSIKDPVVAAFVDVERVIGLIDEAGKKNAEPDEFAQWEKVRDALGLEGLRSLTLSAGFDGKSWATRGFLDAPAPRRGALAVLDQQSIDDELLATIPQTATMASAFNLDLAGVLEIVKQVAVELDPDAAGQIDEGLAGVKTMLGFDLQDGLLKPLGGQWAFYADEETSSSGAFGYVAVNRLRDEDTFRKTLERLESMANVMLAQSMAGEEVEIKIKASEVDGTDLHYVATPLFSPAWAVRDGNLYIALQPQFVAGAAHNVASKKDSFLNHPQLAALRKQIGVEKFSSFRFVDLPKTAPDSYTMITAISRLGVGFADMTGVEGTPAMVVPPLYQLKPHLTASATFGWSDDKGYQLRSVEPFPGSGMFQVGNTGAATWMMTSVMPMAMMTARMAMYSRPMVFEEDNEFEIEDEAIEFEDEPIEEDAIEEAEQAEIEEEAETD
ncbi:MAG: hypothetical protein WBF93_09390 [Pirellulales bacterium]